MSLKREFCGPLVLIGLALAAAAILSPRLVGNLAAKSSSCSAPPAAEPAPSIKRPQ